MITIACTGIKKVNKKYQFFVAVHTSAQCVKPGHPAEAILLSSKLLMGGPCRATPASNS